MARSFDFAVLRLMPDAARGEAVNLGLVVFRADSIEVRIGEVMTRARLLCPEVSPDLIREAIGVMQRFGSAPLPVKERYAAISQIGPFALGALGYFTAEDETSAAFERHVDRLMKLFVTVPHPKGVRLRAKTTIATSIRKAFRAEKVLATIGDAGAISEHKIVPEWPIPLRPSLRVDFALRNRIMRVCEMVDLNIGDDGTPPPKFFEGVVTLDVAQNAAGAEQRIFAYRASGPSTGIDEALSIAESHASMLVDLDNSTQRDEFLHEWIGAAKEQPVATYQ